MATATTTPIAAIQALGQSVWLDNISRKILVDGTLKGLIEEDDLRGVTSNPTIFEKAIGHSADYDEDLKRLVTSKSDDDAIYQDLTVYDITHALDLFRPTYDRTDALDGYVSLEVSPLLARDTAKTTAEAETLWNKLGRPNAMIKIPGTPEGLSSDRGGALRQGDQHQRDLALQRRGLRGRGQGLRLGLDPPRCRRLARWTSIASVASRSSCRGSTARSISGSTPSLKTEADPVKEGFPGSPEGEDRRGQRQGRRGVVRQDLRHGPEFAALKAKGAKVQRLLWASVGTKNPKYPDTLYIDELIGPATVSTMPPATFDAVKDHGKAASTLAPGPRRGVRPARGPEGARDRLQGRDRPAA